MELSVSGCRIDLRETDRETAIKSVADDAAVSVQHNAVAQSFVTLHDVLEYMVEVVGVTSQDEISAAGGQVSGTRHTLLLKFGSECLR